VGPDLDENLGTVIALHRNRIYRYLLGMTGDPDLADDLAQETMLCGMQGAAALREPAAVLPWLYRVATNVLIDRYRAERRRPAGLPLLGELGHSPIDDIAEPGPASDRLVEMGEMSDCVREYVTQLPHHYRAAILLHDGYGLSDQEVADALDISLATAKIHIHRARARLRATLGAACQFELDDRGVLVCQRAPDQAHCPSDCACHTNGGRKEYPLARSGDMDEAHDGDPGGRSTGAVASPRA
jgi:RNA polymerase sigma-70 factor (ECF subfamily)